MKTLARIFDLLCRQTLLPASARARFVVQNTADMRRDSSSVSTVSWNETKWNSSFVPSMLGFASLYPAYSTKARITYAWTKGSNGLVEK